MLGRKAFLTGVVALIILLTMLLITNLQITQRTQLSGHAQESQNPDGTCPYVARVRVYKDSSETLIPVSEFGTSVWGISNNKENQEKPAIDFSMVGGGLASYDYITGYLPKGAFGIYSVKLFYDKTRWKVKKKFCDNVSYSGSSTCPTNPTAQNQSPDDVITGFNVKCNGNADYGWILEQKNNSSDNSILSRLQHGGLIIYMRHAHTDWGQNQRELDWVPEMLKKRSLLADCNRQRLLSTQGRLEAASVGRSMREQGIQIGRVFASPWCRTRDTATLAFGSFEVAADKLFDTGYLSTGSKERKDYNKALRTFLSTPPQGTNFIIVGHMPHFKDVANVELNEGDAAIVEPLQNDFKVLKHIHSDEWNELDSN